MMLVSLISYIDRNTLALLAPTVLKDTGLTAFEYSWIVSAFSVAYMIGNPVWGFLLDRYGVRHGMTVAVAFWTAASAAHALVSNLSGFAAARALLGFGEGATFPGGLRTAIQSLPATSRSRGIALAYSGGSLGAIVAPLIVTPIAIAYGWRAAFLFTGLIGVAWLVLWQFAGRDLKAAQEPRHSKGSINPLDPRLAAFILSYAFGGLPLGFVIYIGSLYLNQARGLDQAQLGRVLWIPPLGWEVGYFFWGWMVDRMRATRTGSYAGLLAWPALLSLGLAFTWSAPSTPIVLFALFLAMFAAAGFVIISIAYATDVFSSNHAGLIAGLGAGSWSLLVAIVMPVFGWFANVNQYPVSFLIAALFPVLGYLLWLTLDRLGSAGLRRAA
jgi:MFS transporter, ACS family, hexuronate transporter